MSIAIKPLKLQPVRMLQGWPILYEDDKVADIGEANLHVQTDEILHLGLQLHLDKDKELQVYSNMDFLYGRDDELPCPYVSPDSMVVRPFKRLPEDQRSYRLGTDGPAPKAVAEILSLRSWEQQDLGDKVELYAKLMISEYLLIDITGELMPEKLVIKRLRKDGTYADEQDEDGGISSELGFRLTIEHDGRLRVWNTAENAPYPRPLEAMREVWRRRSRKKKR